MATFFKSLILGVILLAPMQGAVAAGPLLEAIGGSSSVSVLRAGKEIKLSKGDLLQTGDELKTDANTAVDIRFEDKSIIRVGANSTYRLEENSKVKQMLHRLLSGIVRVIVPPTAGGADGKPMRFRMDTPEGTIGVRGTEFVVIAGKGETTVKGFEGEVLFGAIGADLSDPGQFVAVTEKVESTVRKGGKPMAPKTFDRAKYIKDIERKGGPFAVLAARKSETYLARSKVEVPKAVAAAPAAKAKAKTKGIGSTLNVSRPAKKNESPDEVLFRAASAGDLSAATAALKNGANINYKDKESKTLGFTPLHAASFFGHTDMVKFLVKNRADANAKTANGETPLMIVAQGEGKAENALYLIDNPFSAAKIDETNNKGETALQIARTSLAATTDEDEKVRRQEIVDIIELKIEELKK